MVQWEQNSHEPQILLYLTSRDCHYILLDRTVNKHFLFRFPFKDDFLSDLLVKNGIFVQLGIFIEFWNARNKRRQNLICTANHIIIYLLSTWYIFFSKLYTNKTAEEFQVFLICSNTWWECVWWYQRVSYSISRIQYHHMEIISYIIAVFTSIVAETENKMSYHRENILYDGLIDRLESKCLTYIVRVWCILTEIRVGNGGH